MGSIQSFQLLVLFELELELMVKPESVVDDKTGFAVQVVGLAERLGLPRQVVGLAERLRLPRHHHGMCQVVLGILQLGTRRADSRVVLGSRGKLEVVQPDGLEQTRTNLVVVLPRHLLDMCQVVGDILRLGTHRAD